jgi:hypothetical protein
VFVVCCVGSGVFNNLITHSEECHCERTRVCVCVCVCVGGGCLTVCDLDTSKGGCIGRIWAIAPQKKKTSYKKEWEVTGNNYELHTVPFIQFLFYIQHSVTKGC